MDPDRRFCESLERDCEADECADGVGEGNCGVGDAGESDREETLGGGLSGIGGEGCLEEGDGDLGCGFRRERFERCWTPWELSGGESESPSERKEEYSIWRSDDDDDNVAVHDDNEINDLCELSPVLAPPLAAVAPTDIVLAAEEPAFRVGVGLRNLGNTCFLNSVLQCLVRTAPFRLGLFLIDHLSPCYGVEFCLVCCLRELVHYAFTSFDEISPSSIAANLKYFSPDFVRYQQEDAHEFLQCLLDKLEKFSMLPSNPCSPAPSRNLVKEVFGGSLVSRLRCSECYHISSTPEDLIDFSLEIDDVNTLEGALESFTKLEKIEDVQMICDGCNEKVSVEKQFVIDQAPLVASFHLKRFKNDGITVEKIGKHIEYPLILNLDPYTAGHPDHSADLTYDLYAVIVHDGFSSDSGHYYCYARSSPYTWHEFDDSTVSRVSEYHVLSREAYILFYAKRGTSWFNYNDIQSLRYLVASKYSPNSVLEKVNLSSESDSSTEHVSVWVNRHKEFSEDSYQPTSIGPQLPNSGARITSNRHGEYPDLLSNNENENKTDEDMEDSSFNFDMLLNDDDKENRTETDVTVSSPLDFGLIKDEANEVRKDMPDDNGYSFSSEETKEATVEQTHNNSSLADENFDASSSVHESGNFKNTHVDSPNEEPTTSPNCPAESSGGSLCVTNKSTINKCGKKTKAVSSQTGLSGSSEAKKVPNTLPHKRSAERPVDDARKKQALRTLKRTTMPMTRARKFLAAVNGSPQKKKKKSTISVGTNQNRVVPPSARSTIFR